MSLLGEAKRWAEFLEKYGTPTEISSDEAAQLDPRNVWTLWSRGSDFLANEFSQSDEVLSHWSTPSPWQGEAGTLFYTMTIWIDCPTCEEMFEQDEDWDQDECEECGGAGTLSIDLDECILATTEEEVFERRSSA